MGINKYNNNENSTGMENVLIFLWQRFTVHTSN